MTTREQLIRQHLDPLIEKMRQEWPLPPATQDTIKNVLSDRSAEMQALLIASMIRLFQMQERYKNVTPKKRLTLRERIVNKLKSLRKPTGTVCHIDSKPHEFVNLRVDESCADFNALVSNLQNDPTK